jgi:Uma2 family endonuclease
MGTTDIRSRGATIADLLAIPEADRFHEVIHGELLRKALPTGRHALAQAKVIASLEPYNEPLGGGPGGWWLLPEVEVELAANEVARPDVAGWRRERLPEPPGLSPIRVRPDWVCEVLSASASSQLRDRVSKFAAYRESGVPHYWLVDPDGETLTVHRWTRDGFLVVCTAGRADRVRAEPFTDVELQVGVLFGDPRRPLP